MSGSGAITALGSGTFAVYDGSTQVGTLFATASGGQNVVIIDLKDPRSSPSLGKGIVIASSQTAVNAALTNGRWVGASSTGGWSTFTANGTTLTYTSVNGVAVTNAPSTATPDSPWIGLIATTGNFVSLLAGYGVYITAGSVGYLEVGIKY